MWGRLWVACGVTAAVLCGSLQTAVADDAVAAAKARLQHDVKYLADDSLEGRGVGTQGLDLAAKFVHEQFAAAGLKVDTVGDGPFQSFELVTGSDLGDPNTLTFVGPEGQTIPLKINSDFEVCSFGGSGTFDTGLVFCGYGIDAPDQNYNDFADIDVTGKVVIMMRRNPGQSDPHGPFATAHGISRHAELRTKISQAIQHGAAAVLLVNDPFTIAKAAQDRAEALVKAQAEVVKLADEFLATPEDDVEQVKAQRDKLRTAVNRWKSLTQSAEKPNDDALMKFGYAGHTENPRAPPVFHVTIAQINAVLSAALGKTLAELEAAIDADAKPKSAVLVDWKVQGAATVNQVKSQVSNIIATLEGTGPLADETIVIGAHYDHIGRGGSNSLARGSNEVHNGADDNGSGTAALLELARRLAARPQKLPRRLVFIAFTAEELGLIGSGRYVKEPVYPLENTVAMFNMDMVGRLQDDKLTVFGTGTSSRWEAELADLNQQAGFKMTYKPEGFGPSDHSSFYGKKIPVLHLFTGNHPDYHRPSDTWEKLNIDGMYRVVDLLEQIVVKTAENPERPDYIEVKRAPTAQRDGSRPYFGTIPDFGGEEEGYAISGAAPGSPADKGGMKGGDRIVDLGGNKIATLDDFDLALRKFKAGDEVAVTVMRDGKPVKLTVKLEPPR